MQEGVGHRAAVGRHGALVVLVLIAAMMTGSAWAFSSPPGSSPDEDFHAASIWCPAPIETSGCRPVRNQSGEIVGVMVPQAVVAPAWCYAFHNQQSGARCLASLRSSELVEVQRVNLGLYPGLYYSVAHVFVGQDVSHSFLRIRLFNVFLAVAILGSLIALAPAGSRQALALSWVGAAVPLGLFLVGSINPSAWAMAGVAGCWMGLVVTLNSQSRLRSLGAGALTLVSASMAAGARSDAGVYVMFIALVTALVASARIREWGGRAVVPLLVLGVGTWSYFSSTQTNLLQGTWTLHPDRDPRDIFLTNIQDVPNLLAGMVGGGGWGLGWLDTPMPGVVGVGVWMVVSGTIFSGLRDAGRRKTLGFLAVGGVIVALPLVTLQSSSAYVGELIQPRYILPLLPVLLGICLLHEDPRLPTSIGRLPALLAAVLLTGAHGLALYTNLRRYVTGLGQSGLTTGSSEQWWWNGPVPPSVVFAVGAAAFPVVTLAFLLPLSLQGRPRPMWVGAASAIPVEFEAAATVTSHSGPAPARTVAAGAIRQSPRLADADAEPAPPGLTGAKSQPLGQSPNNPAVSAAG